MAWSGACGARAPGGAGVGVAVAWGEERPPDWERTDPCLVDAARGGCEASLGTLFECVGGRVRRTTRRILRDEHAAEDAVQDTFVAVLTGLRRLEDPHAFDGWVLRIARNVAINAARRRSRCVPSPYVHADDHGHVVGERVLARSGCAEATPLGATLLRAQYASLSSLVRETLELRYGAGLSCEAIARRQGVSIAAVKTRLHRARADLYAAARAAWTT